MKRYDLLLAVVLLCVTVSPVRGGEPSMPDKPGVFAEVWEIVRDHFYDPEYNGVDWEVARGRYANRAKEAETVDEFASAVNDMLSELGVSHTHYYTRWDPAYYQLLDLFKDGPMGEEIEKFFPDMDLGYTGIGVFTNDVEGMTFVAGVLESGPAHKAGLRIGDRIVSAGGKAFHPIRSFEGREGKEVSLSIQSTSNPNDVRDVVVVPERIHPNDTFLESMRSSIRVVERDGFSIGYIHVWSYAGEQYHDLLVEEVAWGTLKEADALVLDIRDGWGGANPNYLNIFNRKVPVLSQTDRAGETFTFDFQWRKPVALVVNGGTRSGKEVIAYGFKKYGIGKVIGERTAGAVTAGRPFLLSDGSLLYLAVADVLVDGERLEGGGVRPDVDVRFPVEYAQGRDPQIEKAVEILVEQLKGK
jgi:carboxyl-terminal processing protease